MRKRQLSVVDILLADEWLVYYWQMSSFTLTPGQFLNGNHFKAITLKKSTKWWYHLLTTSFSAQSLRNRRNRFLSLQQSGKAKMKKLIKVYFPCKYGTKYSRIDQVKFFKGCLPQFLLGPFLNTLSRIKLAVKPK